MRLLHVIVAYWIIHRSSAISSRAQLVGRACAVVPGGSRLLHRLAVGGRSQRQAGVIFMLHRVLEDGSAAYDPEMAVATAAFEAFAQWLKSRFEPVPLAHLVAQLGRPAAPARRPLCALTFDDGWVDTYSQAFPLLQRYQLPATVYLPLHFIGTQRRFWQERLGEQVAFLQRQADGAERLRVAAARFAWCPPLGAAELSFARLRARLVRRASSEAEEFVAALAETGTPATPGRSFMNWEEVGVMQAAGIEFGSHTLDHTLLACAPPREAERQLLRSRQELSERLGQAVGGFSYPWGALSPLTRAQAGAAGYELAVTTQPAWASATGDRLRLPRVALSNAQLGWPHGAGLRPQGLEIQLARARRRRAPLPPRAAAGPLRIGFFVDNPAVWGRQPQWDVGGSELQIRHQLEALQPPYFAPELYFAQAPESGFPTDLPWPAFTASHAGRWSGVLGLFRLLRRRRPDLVHSLFLDSLFRGVPAAWAARVPAIISARRNANYWKTGRHRLLLPLINRMVTGWQTNAASINTVLEQEEGIPDRAIEILPNWLDLERFTPASKAAQLAARRRLCLPEDAWIVVSVANYRPVKNLPLLLDAASAVAPSCPEALFLLIGAGPERDELQQQIECLHLERHVRLVGESDQIPAYLAAANVGCLTSHSEGCSNAVLEYMAAGLATALSDIPANRGLTDEGLFTAGDAAALAVSLQQLAAHPEQAAAMGRRHRLRAEQYGATAFQERVQAHFLRAAGTVLRR